MKIGELKHRIKLQSATAVVGALGVNASEPTWADVAEVWAFVRPLRAVEQIRAAQPEMETQYIVKMRYRQVEPEWRIQWRGKLLYIDGIIDVDGRGAILEIMCGERSTTPG